LERAIREVLAVGRARGVALDDDELFRILEFCALLPENNKPSLLRDLEAGRPPEIDDLSGAVSRMGRAVGVVAISLASTKKSSVQFRNI
jgi:2-dehydropantoate 2-reductase